MEQKFETILVPTNFSECSMRTLEKAFSISDTYKLDIVLLHVAEKNFSLFSGKSVKNKYYEECRGKLQKIADEASKKTGIKINSVVEDGKVAKKISEAAERFLSKYIVINVNDEKPDKAEKYIGSTTLSLIKEPNCNMIILNSGKVRPNISNILVPLDMTKETRHKITNAVEVAKHYNSKMYVMCILSQEEDREIIYRKHIQMKQVEKFLTDSEANFTTKFIEAPLKQSDSEIYLNYAKEINADLILIMIKQERADMSITLDIIKKSDVPVICPIPRRVTREGAM